MACFGNPRVDALLGVAGIYGRGAYRAVILQPSCTSSVIGRNRESVLFGKSAWSDGCSWTPRSGAVNLWRLFRQREAVFGPSACGGIAGQYPALAPPRADCRRASEVRRRQNGRSGHNRLRPRPASRAVALRVYHFPGTTIVRHVAMRSARMRKMELRSHGPDRLSGITAKVVQGR